MPTSDKAIFSGNRYTIKILSIVSFAMPAIPAIKSGVEKISIFFNSLKSIFQLEKIISGNKRISVKQVAIRLDKNI